MYCEVVTITNLVNTYLLIVTKKNKIFPRVQKLEGKFFKSNFPINHTAVLTLVILLYITSLGFIYLITGSLYLMATSIQLPASPYSLTFFFLFVMRTFKIYSLGTFKYIIQYC